MPANDIRKQIEAKRQASLAKPKHPNEARDAPIHVLQQAWLDTRSTAINLGLVPDTAATDGTAYDATTYSRLFQHILQHRNCCVLNVDRLYPAAGSVYDLEVDTGELAASAADVSAVLKEMANTMSAEEISQAVDNWHQI